MSKKPLDLVGQTFHETYYLLRLIGVGGMGEVYEAQHLRLARHFAVKVLSPRRSSARSLERFEREARVTSAIGHPHIIDVVDFNRTADGRPYIVMELLQGDDLRARTKAVGAMELHEVASIVRQTCSALHAAHQREVVHRDVKPANIYLCQRGLRGDYVKVLDFGISKLATAAAELTSSDEVVGSPRYMAPEQIDEHMGRVGPHTDVYALATVAFEVLAGAPPFHAGSVSALMFKIIQDEPPRLSELRADIDDGVAEVIARALRKRPDERIPTVRQLWNELDRALRRARVEFYEPTEDRQWFAWTGESGTASAADASSASAPAAGGSGPGAARDAAQAMALMPTVPAADLPALPARGLEPPTEEQPGLEPPTEEHLGLELPTEEHLGPEPPNEEQLGLEPPTEEQLGLEPPTEEHPSVAPPTQQRAAVDRAPAATVIFQPAASPLRSARPLQPEPVPSSTLRVAPASRRRGRPLLLGLLGLALAVVLVAAGVLLLRGDRNQEPPRRGQPSAGAADQGAASRADGAVPQQPMAADAATPPDGREARDTAARPQPSRRDAGRRPGSARRRRGGQGSLFVSTRSGKRPTWANLYVDGRRVGTTPRWVRGLRAGRHRVRVERDGRSRSQQIRIRRNQTTRISIDIQAR